MSDNESKKTSPYNDGIKSISDEEAITEIDFGSFLADGQDNSAVIAGLHSDIEATEKSLDSEIQNLYDSIMSSGPSTIVPRTMDDITAEEKSEKNSPLSDMWMNPEEYIDIPFVELEEDKKEPEPDPMVLKAKDDIMDMIEALKTETETDSDNRFTDILNDIESNKDIDAVNAEDLSAAAQVAFAGQKPGEKTILSDIDEIFPPANTVTNSTRNSDLYAEADKIPAGGNFFPAHSANESASAAEPEAHKSTVPFYESNPLPEFKSTIGIFPEDLDKEEKLSRKDRKNAKKEAKEKAGEEKQSEGGKGVIRKIVLTISIITIIVSLGILVNTYVIEPYKFKKSQKEIENIVVTNNVEEATAVVDDSYSNTQANIEYPEGMLAKYAKLYEINQDMSGWISIPALDINLPIAQGKDNEYYLKRNIYKRWTDYGVTFFDYRIEDLRNLPRNTVVYGHNMRHDDLIFGLLENYRDISTFRKAPVIECNTIYGDHTWFVYAVFITNSTASQDNGYLFPYNFIDVSTSKFEDYIKEIDKRKLYTTGIDINANDNILTLSTCCYDFDEARLVVVAREKRAGESSTPDTSKAIPNPNPKYPQIWYTTNKKQNPYIDDARW